MFSFRNGVGERGRAHARLSECDFRESAARDALDLVHHVIDIAQVLKKEVVAEGVETGEQFAVLKKVGCQFIQGYFVSPPLPSSEFLNFIAEHEMLRTQGYRETRSSNG